MYTCRKTLNMKRYLSFYKYSIVSTLIYLLQVHTVDKIKVGEVEEALVDAVVVNVVVVSDGFGFSTENDMFTVADPPLLKAAIWALKEETLSLVQFP